MLFAWLNALGGLQRGRAVQRSLLIAVTFTLLYRLVRRKSNPIVAILVTMLAAAASSIHWLARPHLFTLLFLVLFYAALERVREGRPRLAGVPYLAMLPVVTVLWTNLHGGFFVGHPDDCRLRRRRIADHCLFPPDAGSAAGRLAKRARLLPERRWPAWRRAWSIRTRIICTSHMAQYLRDPWNSQHIIEFLSPNFHHPTAIFFEAMLVLAAAAALVRICARAALRSRC